MYQINLRAQASRLAALTTRRSLSRAAQPAEPPQRAASLRAALAGLANLAALRVMIGSACDTATRPDPRDPHNW